MLFINKIQGMKVTIMNGLIMVLIIALYLNKGYRKQND